mmetsp:Transcript_36786/g.117129  ORF Transcript_36786/g.117129 Transcript_36786/m.117129 type:complete len:201 (-) Transcript_36786:466-1068(-)|eukprot:scaffold10796_cov114-Isochrysis_galbana.AAC.4
MRDLFAPRATQPADAQRRHRAQRPEHRCRLRVMLGACAAAACIAFPCNEPYGLKAQPAPGPHVAIPAAMTLEKASGDLDRGVAEHARVALWRALCFLCAVLNIADCSSGGDGGSAKAASRAPIASHHRAGVGHEGIFSILCGAPTTPAILATPSAAPSTTACTEFRALPGSHHRFAVSTTSLRPCCPVGGCNGARIPAVN